MKKQCINYSLKKKHLINTKKLNKLNEELLSQYKVVLVNTNRELLEHTIHLGHCVGTAGYNNMIRLENCLIFGIKENNILKFTAQYSLIDNKLRQVEGKSFSTMNDDEKDKLQELISRSLKK